MRHVYSQGSKLEVSSELKHVVHTASDALLKDHLWRQVHQNKTLKLNRRCLTLYAFTSNLGFRIEFRTESQELDHRVKKMVFGISALIGWGLRNGRSVWQPDLWWSCPLCDSETKVRSDVFLSCTMINSYRDGQNIHLSCRQQFSTPEPLNWFR